MDEQIIKYCKGLLTREEEQLLLDEAFINPDLKSKIIKVQHAFTLNRLQKENANEKTGKMQYEKFQKLILKNKLKNYCFNCWQYAALIIISFSASWFIFHSINKKQQT